MVACDSCSLAEKCKYFRVESVCTLPGTETVKMADQFNTRDAQTIIDSLSRVLQRGAERMERGLDLEEALGDFDPEVSKMMNQVFAQGVQLAKLKDPQRFSTGAKVQVNVGTNGAASIAASSPAQFVAAAYAELESRGIRREDITPEMVRGMFEGMNPEADPDVAPKAILGTVVHSEQQ